MIRWCGSASANGSTQQQDGPLTGVRRRLSLPGAAAVTSRKPCGGQPAYRSLVLADGPGRPAAGQPRIHQAGRPSDPPAAGAAALKAATVPAATATRAGTAANSTSTARRFPSAPCWPKPGTPALLQAVAAMPSGGEMARFGPRRRSGWRPGTWTSTASPLCGRGNFEYFSEDPLLVRPGWPPPSPAGVQSLPGRRRRPSSTLPATTGRPTAWS